MVDARGARKDCEWLEQHGVRQGGDESVSRARATGRHGHWKYRMDFGAPAGGVRAQKNRS